MTQPKASSFHKVVGSEIRRIRQYYEWRQEELAEKARQEWGLNWNRATVAAIESGKRELCPVEFLLLLPLLNLETYRQLFPANQAIAITPEVVLTSEVLKELFSPDVTPEQISDNRQFQESWAGVDEGLRIVKRLQLELKKFPKDSGFWRKLKQQAAGDAEQKAARKFGVRPMVIAVASYDRWNRSLSEERDVRALAWYNLYEDVKQPFQLEDLTDKWSRRLLQTFRGHVTRELLRELEPIVKRR
jgi:transcriptional regulator with XRE-family HTH domain